MKAKNLLKVLFTAVAVFAFSATFAQENAPWENMTGSSLDAGTDSVTVSSTLPYYVEPDPVLNSLSGQYDPNQANGDQGVNSTFLWSNTGAGTITFDNPATSGADAPYNTVTFPAAPVDGVIVTVQENSAAGCNGTTTPQEVDVIAAPSITVDDGTRDLEICEGTEDVIIAAIEADQITGESNYQFLLDIDKRIYEADGTTEISSIYVNQDSVINLDTADVTDAVLLKNYSFTCGTDGIGDKRITKYRFDFGTSIDADAGASTGNGVTNHISRKSDYLSLATTGDLATDTQGKTKPDLTTYGSYSGLTNYNWYFTSGGDADSDMITVTVYPTPQTGDIYFVPNDFDL